MNVGLTVVLRFADPRALGLRALVVFHSEFGGSLKSHLYSGDILCLRSRPKCCHQRSAWKTTSRRLKLRSVFGTANLHERPMQPYSRILRKQHLRPNGFDGICHCDSITCRFRTESSLKVSSRNLYRQRLASTASMKFLNSAYARTRLRCRCHI